MEATVQLLHKYRRGLCARNFADVIKLTGRLAMFAVQHRAYGSVAILQLTVAENQTADGRLAALYEPVLTGLGQGILTVRGIE